MSTTVKPPVYCTQCGIEIKKHWDLCRNCGFILKMDEYIERQRYGWEMHPGNNIFFCRGRFVTGNNLWNGLLNLFLNISIFVLFCVFDYPYLSAHLSPAVPAFGSLLMLLTMISLFSVALSDPGIIPRGIKQEVDEKENGEIPAFRKVNVNGATISCRYCKTCQIFRPPRTSHCRQCNNCVDKFDHHCPWIGNCIGERNYRFFIFYIFWQLVLSIYVFAFSITHLVKLSLDHSSFGQGLKGTPATVIVILFSGGAILMVSILVSYHCRLISSNITTNEDFKLVTSPYDLGCKMNWIRTLFGPRPSSQLLSRERLEDNIQPKNRTLIGVVTA